MTLEEKSMQIDSLESQIRTLVSSLTAPTSTIGDWKIIKCYEAKLLEDDMPYDLDSLIEQRQSTRDKINELQEQITELEQTEAEEEEENNA